MKNRFLPQADTETLLETLQKRFEKNMHRHPDVSWTKVEEKLRLQPEKLWVLHQLESTEGEPDVILYDAESDAVLFVDCSPESPKGRRSLCYDKAAWDARKLHKPENNAMDTAAAMGAAIINEDEYQLLQTKGDFDLKTSSWLETPEAIRKRGGAIFGDKRYDHVFIYHNGADSYYGARGFRCKLWV